MGLLLGNLLLGNLLLGNLLLEDLLFGCHVSVQGSSPVPKRALPEVRGRLSHGGNIKAAAMPNPTFWKHLTSNRAEPPQKKKKKGKGGLPSGGL